MRALKKDGINAFRDWIHSLDDDPNAKPPLHLLENEDYSFVIPDSSDLVHGVFTDKFAFATALLPFVQELERLNVNHECWPGIWDAMALLFFDSICPRNPDGTWNPNRVEHYVYDPGFRVRHRHRVYGPVALVRTGGENVLPFFRAQPCVLGDFEEQIGPLQEIAGNPGALQILRALYAKNGQEVHIPGFTNRKKYKGFKRKLPVPGSLRRFTTISQQLKRTYDLAAISLEGYQQLLPTEFNEWLDT